MRARFFWCLPPLALFAPDALAWGLQTHVFFAQWALLAAPLADPALRAAVARFPRLVLAGACLPDLALAGKALETPAFRRSHRWATLRRIASGNTREEHALAVGYASHLLVDVVAHHRFVPEHEARIARIPHVTHAIAEFAMDHYVAPFTFASPGDLLASEGLADFVAERFGCRRVLAQRALHLLGRADGALRASSVPALCRRVAKCFDRRLERRFEAYARRTAQRLRLLEAALAGRISDWSGLDAERGSGDEPTDGGTREHIARIVQSQCDA